MKDILLMIKENPRYLALLVTVAVQMAEKAGYQVDFALVETALDLATAIAIGVVMKKSKEGKVL